MKPAPMPVEELQKLLEYRNDGNLVWLRRRGRGEVGAVAGKPSKGYISVGISGRSYQAHRLVWFLNTREWPNEQINHINGIKSDNRIENLEISSSQHNMLHAYRHGLLRADEERNGRALITREQAREILSSTATHKQAADRYGISKAAVQSLRRGRTWKSVHQELKA